MELMHFQVNLMSVSAVVLSLYFSVVYTDVQSDSCPVNCINRTCLNPATNHFRCTYGCINESFYGARCETPCPTTCTICHRSFNKNQTCYACKEGYYLTGAAQTCTLQCPMGCRTCSSGDNCTACNSGYYQTEPSTTCSQCPQSCVACLSPTDCSECKDGFNGTSCQYCIEGKHGPNCSLDCPTGCRTCFSVDNCTSCQLGYYQTEPSTTCSQCPQSCVACTSPTDCSECEAGFNGTSCQYCIDGKYGTNCAHDCLDNCQACLSEDVCTVCKVGSYNGIYNGQNVTNCSQVEPPCPVNCLECSNPSDCTKCKGGFFSTDSNKTCSNECPSGCVTCESDINCTMCKDNFVGDICNSCLAGKHGENCSLDCPMGCKTCSSAENCMDCEDGYYKNISLSSCNQCPLSCDSCTSETDCSECKEGFNGTSCQYCIDGKYGTNCAQDCPNNCQACISEEVCTVCINDYYNGIYNGHNVTNCSLTEPPCPTNCLECTDSSACTKCKDGFFNTDANKTCSNECPSDCAACESDVNCTMCKGKFAGDICDECVDGNYGEVCNETCPENCLSCLSGTNCTACQDGYYNGISPNNATEIYNDCRLRCPDTCVTCADNTQCGACRQNFNGSACEHCVHGRFGDNCNETCSINCLSNICQRETGFCTDCPLNFMGDHCDECLTGMYGEHCNLSCSVGCLNNTCERYSANCTEGCTYQNVEGAQCDRCMEGYHGNFCNSTCPENCSDNMCRRSNGTCFSCKENFDGDFCERCVQGKHGSDCQLNCSTNCKDMECDKRDGNCSSCTSGYYGPFCTNHCSLNCRNETCQQNDGSCSYGCKEDFSGDKCCLNNTFCNICSDEDNCEVCVAGNFGKYCNESCSPNCNAQGCDKETGMCMGCMNHFFGPMCENHCPTGCSELRSGDNRCNWETGACLGDCETGLYASMCNETCSNNCFNSTCTKDGGECLQCIPGYMGATCNVEAEPVTEEKSKAGLIAGICAGLAGLVIIGIVAVLLVRRMRNKKDEPDLSPNSVVKPVTKEQKPTTNDELHMADVSSVEQHPRNGDAKDNVYQNQGGDYYNMANMRKKVAVADLEKYVKQTPDEDLRKEFKLIPGGLLKPYDESKKPENQTRNRYAGIYPYDHNRVKLSGLSSDYINASYINGNNQEKAYIACLGPTNASMDDFKLFWRMVWQEKVERIVMLTNLMEVMNMKCEQYWPNIKNTITYGDIKVTNLDENISALYTVRTFAVAKGQESRDLYQVHFTAWPDKGVPDHVTSIVEFYGRVQSLKHDLNGPVLVHCSAGIGRTGTYIGLDILTEEGEDKGKVDIFNCVMGLRYQRVNMVQTPEQYVYLHKAVAHTLTYGSQTIQAGEFLDYVSYTSDDEFQQQFSHLHATLEKLTQEETDSVQENMSLSMLNRNGADIPANRHRPHLYKYQTTGDKDYINAVYVNSFKDKDRFIAAQTPLPATTVDFIKLILQEECTCVVNLEQDNLKVKNIGHYLPPDQQTVTEGPFQLSCRKLISPETYSLHQLTIKHEGMKDPVAVYCFQYKEWPGNRTTPVNHLNFLSFIKEVKHKAKETSQEEGRILVHCLSGAIKCGLFCAVHNAVEKMDNEQQVSIGNILRQILYRRRKAFPNKDQLVFCYKAVAEYLKSFDIYSNFNFSL